MQYAIKGILKSIILIICFPIMLLCAIEAVLEAIGGRGDEDVDGSIGIRIIGRLFDW